MTNRLFNKITAFIRPLNRPQALTTMLLSNLAKFSLIVAMREGGMGASFGSCLNISPVFKTTLRNGNFYWNKFEIERRLIYNFFGNDMKIYLELLAQPIIYNEFQCSIWAPEVDSREIFKISDVLTS